jgi:hypothetical protein
VFWLVLVALSALIALLRLLPLASLCKPGIKRFMVNNVGIRYQLALYDLLMNQVENVLPVYARLFCRLRGANKISHYFYLLRW